jgi:hypothetical protein
MLPFSGSIDKTLRTSSLDACRQKNAVPQPDENISVLFSSKQGAGGPTGVIYYYIDMIDMNAYNAYSVVMGGLNVSRVGDNNYHLEGTPAVIEYPETKEIIVIAKGLEDKYFYWYDTKARRGAKWMPINRPQTQYGYCFDSNPVCIIDNWQNILTFGVGFGGAYLPTNFASRIHGKKKMERCCLDRFV